MYAPSAHLSPRESQKVGRERPERACCRSEVAPSAHLVGPEAACCCPKHASPRTHLVTLKTHVVATRMPRALVFHPEVAPSAYVFSPRKHFVAPKSPRACILLPRVCICFPRTHFCFPRTHLCAENARKSPRSLPERAFFAPRAVPRTHLCCTENAFVHAENVFLSPREC